MTDHQTPQTPLDDTQAMPPVDAAPQQYDPSEIRAVTIPSLEEHGGYDWNKTTVRLHWRCPVCDEPRGEPGRVWAYDGSRRMTIDGWINLCGHTDTYADMRREAAQNGLNDDAPDVVVHLTDEQREILKKAAEIQRYHALPVSAFDDNLEQCRLLVDLGLFTEPSHAWFKITDAGRAAIAPQPGEGLPESDAPEGGDVLPDVSDEQLDELRGQLVDRQTSINLLHDLNNKLRSRNESLEAVNAQLTDRIEQQDAQFVKLRVANERKSEALTNMRIERDIARKQLEQRSPDDLAQLAARVDELAEIVLEPQYALVEPVGRSTKVEVWTLHQSIHTSTQRVVSDDQLAAALNNNWSVLHIGVEVEQLSDGEWTYRIVTLTREVEAGADDGSDPDARVEVEPPADPVSDLMPDRVLDATIGGIDLIQTYVNAADAARRDGLIVHRGPVVSIYPS